MELKVRPLVTSFDSKNQTGLSRAKKQGKKTEGENKIDILFSRFKRI